jgi:hypothetical protein
MPCPCPRCNGTDDLRTFFGGSLESTTEEPEEVKGSVYDRLAGLSKELDKAGVQGSLINELNEIAEEVDDIDSEIIKLKNERDTEIWIELGELSKRLY